MQVEGTSGFEKAGSVLGYTAAYVMFSAVFFWVLSFAGKLPAHWSFFHVIGITFVIMLLGILIKRLLR
jgi:hypothetical protein